MIVFGELFGYYFYGLKSILHSMIFGTPLDLLKNFLNIPFWKLLKTNVPKMAQKGITHFWVCFRFNFCLHLCLGILKKVKKHCTPICVQGFPCRWRKSLMGVPVEIDMHVFYKYRYYGRIVQPCSAASATHSLTYRIAVRDHASSKNKHGGKMQLHNLVYL